MKHTVIVYNKVQVADLAVPTVHLNGSHGPQLVENFAEAGKALSNAIDAMADAAPHERDFYVQGFDAYIKAANAHEARISILRVMREEMELLALAVHSQLAERSK